MREILFRAKRLNSDEWICGYLWVGVEHSFIIPYNLGVDFTNNRITAYALEVVPETISQYIELTDKNGKKIFEGDIVSNGVFRANVAFVKGRFYPFAGGELQSIYEDECEVIGNVYDNPELLNN